MPNIKILNIDYVDLKLAINILLSLCCLISCYLDKISVITSLQGGKFCEALGKWEVAIRLLPDKAILHEQKAQVLLEIGEAWNALKAATRISLFLIFTNNFSCFRLFVHCILVSVDSNFYLFDYLHDHLPGTG